MPVNTGLSVLPGLTIRAGLPEPMPTAPISNDVSTICVVVPVLYSRVVAVGLNF